MRDDMALSDDSSSDTSSERSLSPSPTSSSCSRSSLHFPVYPNPIRIPLKSPISPPSTTSSDISLSPVTPPSLSPHSVICAFPSWPSGNFLTSKPSAFSHIADSRGNQPSSRISDEDLLGLEELELYGDVRVPTGMMGSDSTTPNISWEETKQPPAVMVAASKRSISLLKKKRRRSSPLYRRRSVKSMSPIPEGAE